jgi:hypothetical protein
MAKKRKRKYSPGAGKEVEGEMRRYKTGKAKSGPGRKGGKVKSRKQAIAVGLAKARKKGKKVPPKKSASKKSASKKSVSKKTKKKTSSRKASSKKVTASRKAGSKKKSARKTSSRKRAA